MSAWECPALFTMVPFVEHEYGIYHVQGGLNAISLAMEKVLDEQGVHVRNNTTVKRFLVDGRCIKGIELENGEICTADDFVINADFSYAMTNLFRQDDLRKYKQERFNRMRYSCSTFMLYLGINTLYPIPHHNVFFAQDYKTNVEDIFINMKLSPENSFYIQNASVSDPTLAPEGKSTIYILVPVPHNRSGIDWDAEKERFREHILNQVESRSELSDLRKHIEVEKMITPTDWERDENVYLGATFNLGHNISQMLYLRPRNKFEEFNNCYLVGGGTHPGSGLPTIYESARISANLISQKYGIAFKPPSALSNKVSFA
jgi:phytoene desaturase